MAGVVEVVGERFDTSTPGTPWRNVIRGGSALAFAWALPFLGWFGLLPLSLVVGTGATTLGLFRRLTESAPAPAHHVSTTAPLAKLGDTSVSAFAPVSPWR